MLHGCTSNCTEFVTKLSPYCFLPYGPLSNGGSQTLFHPPCSPPMGPYVILG